MNPSITTLRLCASRAAVGAAIAALFLVLAGCSHSDDGKKPAAAAGASKSAEAKLTGAKEGKEGGDLKLSPEEAKRAGIEVQVLQSQTQTDVVTVTATIKPNQDRIARVAPRVEGRVIRVSANLGDNVRVGQALATLDSVALGEAQSVLLQAQSAQRVAQADFQRAQTLAAEEIIPQREFLRARAALEKATAELRAAQDKLRLLGGTPGTGRAQADFQLHAPFAGTVIQKKATVGELATPADPLFTVADLSKVWIEANLTEELLARVRKGALATVTVGAYPEVRFPGRVTYIAGLLNPETRTISARIEVDNRDGRLKPEMFATAMIETGQPKGNALTVPDAAIVLMQGVPTIFVAKGDGYEPRPVELGEKSGGRTVIRSGAQAGDQVITAGAYALKARLLKSQISAE